MTYKKIYSKITPNWYLTILWIKFDLKHSLKSEVWSLNTFKREWVSLFHDQFSHALIHIPRCLVGNQSFCLVSQELFVESAKKKKGCGLRPVALATGQKPCPKKNCIVGYQAKSYQNHNILSDKLKQDIRLVQISSNAWQAMKMWLMINFH